MTQENKAAVAAMQSAPAKARYEGQAARKSGRAKTDNPYFWGARNGWNFDQWNRGYDAPEAA